MLNPIQKAFLMLENRRECRAAISRTDFDALIDPGTDGMTYAEGRGQYNLLTDKIIDVCGAVCRTRGDMQSTWARHLSALLVKRDRFKHYAQ